MHMKKTIVGLKELRENIETYISGVKKGRSFIVVRRSKPVLKISSPDEEQELWETVVDFTEIGRNGVAAREVLKTLRTMNV
jgi:antitoxin (DNA-binding transcriptional repressor) of toxin-antitoxin stability system